MQSLLSYGRVVSRLFASGVYNVASGQASQSTSAKSHLEPKSAIDYGKKFKFVTAVSGFSKSTALDKVRPGKFGDDACFVAKHSTGDVLGVADGVGGWREWGIDPGEFSHTLMEACEKLVLKGRFSPNNPCAIIASAYSELLEKKTHILGSSTACIVVLHATLGRLFSANIGDSGFLVVRRGCVVHRSQDQQHYFNTPFQLSVPPPGVSQVLSDSPESAVKQEFDIQIGDLVVLATDGVFDNLPESLLLGELIQVGDRMADTKVLEEAANAIASRARSLAFNEKYMSPFALNARQNGIEATGGKPDDITVIIASVMG